MNPDSAVAARTIVRPAIGTVVAGVIGTVWGAIVAGGPGVVAGIMATVVVLVFFALGQVAVQRVMANNPAMGLNVALGVYLGQILLLFILLIALRDATFFDPKVFAGTIVACALVWLGDQLGVGAQMTTGVVVVLAMRIFANLAAIRRKVFKA